MAIIERKTDAGRTKYLVRVRDPFGRWFPSKTFDRKIEAEQYERSLLIQRDRGGLAPTQEFREMTFAEYWAKWSNECRGRVSEGWRRTQDMVTRKHLLPMLGHRRFKELRSVDIGQLMAALERKGQSPQSALHLYNILHKMFEDAVEFYEILDRNPVRRRFRPKVRRIERDFLSPAESWKLLESVRHHRLGGAIWIGLLAGLRPGETQALRWSAVDFERSQILIRASFNKKLRVIQDQPKQGDWGRAPMPPVLAAFLQEHARGKRPEDFVVPNVNGGMMIYESFVTQILPRLCREAGVKEVTPHELRHSCTELYVQQGASAEDLRRLLNHKSLSATVRYMHRTDERLAGIAGRVGRSLAVDPGSNPLNHEKPVEHENVDV
ncbi:MAG: site-specific integrase [Bdellovibrionales bacterium]|nr:site-specific integrase [Bdellovibrionales bacterium]